MYKKRLITITILLITIILPISVYAHFLGYDSVDGGEIRWEDYTIYNDAFTWANQKWDDLGQVNIAPDTWYVATDLEWLDVDRSDVTWDGRYYQNWGADHIELNKHYLKNYTTNKRRAVAVHELGHALGLAHSYSTQIMYSCSTCSGHTTPQSHDIQDYNELW